jgi:arylsulfatase A-like enzyme
MTAREDAMSRLPMVRDILTVGVATALLVGIAHVVVVEVQLHVLHRLTWTSREFVWMAPLAYVICFLPVALLLSGAAALWPRRVSLRVAAMPILVLGALSLILLKRGIYPAAEVVLALGAGIQAARLLGGRRERTMALARRFTVAGAVVVILAGALAAGWRATAERLALRGLAAPDGDPPNVLMIILDTVRASSMGLYGYERANTPVLDSLAGESTVFDHAFSSAPWTLPSHASVFTGLWPQQSGGTYRTPIHSNAATLAEQMRARGYATGGFSANLGYVSHETGLQRGFVRFEDFPVGLDQLMLSPTLLQTNSGQMLIDAVRNGERWRVRQAIQHPDLQIVGTHMSDPPFAGDVADRFFRWRDGIAHGPYFAMLNFMNAHNPYESPTAFSTRFNHGANPADRYDGAIAYMDSIIGSIVDRLRRRGDLDRTIVVVMSDHGELFGEHGLQGHGSVMYVPVVHVPLLIRAPGRVPEGLRVQALVSLRDLAATLLELTHDTTMSLPGTSLSHAWRADGVPTSGILLQNDAGDDAAATDPATKGVMGGLVDSTGHYIRLADGSELLYAWRRDTAEAENLANTVEGRARIAQMRREMAAVFSPAIGTARSDSRR